MILTVINVMSSNLFLQVPLGVYLKNENKHSEMVDIMHTLHQYVPIVSDTSEDDSHKTTAVHKLLFGGDQLTAARARGCRDLRLNSETTVGQLQGLVPVANDWHTSVT